MEITEELITNLNGEYFKEGIKKTTSPSGALIIQNSYGIVKKKEQYSIHIYCFDNKEIRAVGTYDGSPFKVSLILPYELSQKTSIFPKYFFKSLFLPFIIPSFATKVDKKFLKKFKIKGSEEFKSTFLKHEFLSDIISTHNLYISTRIENGF